eukprot:Clim_evm4s52 gene=Clim_evmTU4s52
MDALKRTQKAAEDEEIRKILGKWEERYSTCVAQQMGFKYFTAAVLCVGVPLGIMQKKYWPLIPAGIIGTFADDMEARRKKCWAESDMVSDLRKWAQQGQKQRIIEVDTAAEKEYQQDLTEQDGSSSSSNPENSGTS